MNDIQPHDAFSTKLEGGMRRREFLISGVKASFCIIGYNAIGLPAFAQRAVNEAPLPPVSTEDSINILVDYLSRYTPPQGQFPANGSWKATYDITCAGTDKNPVKWKSVNTVFGNATVMRRPAGEAGVAYEVDYTNTLFEFESSLKSSLRCSSERLPRLIEWTTEYETHVDLRKAPRKGFFDWGGAVAPAGSVPPASLREQGRHKDGVLEISTTLSVRKLKTDRPVAPQWVVLDALRNAKADPSDPMAGVEFDLFHDLTSYRPHQRLVPCGVLEIAMGMGTPQTFHGYIQTGAGVEPTHYWIDSLGRPLFVTEGVNAIALKSIEPA